MTDKHPKRSGPGEEAFRDVGPDVFPKKGHAYSLPRFLGALRPPTVKGLTIGVIFENDPLPPLG
jgi:hypothetical protein